MQEIATKTGEIIGYILSILIILALIYTIVMIVWSDIKEFNIKKEYKKNLRKNNEITKLMAIEEYESLKVNLFTPWKGKKKNGNN